MVAVYATGTEVFDGCVYAGLLAAAVAGVCAGEASSTVKRPFLTVFFSVSDNAALLSASEIFDSRYCVANDTAGGVGTDGSAVPSTVPTVNRPSFSTRFRLYYYCFLEFSDVGDKDPPGDVLLFCYAYGLVDGTTIAIVGDVT